MVWPGGNNMVFSMAWWAWRGILYGLTGMGHGTVYGIAR